MKGVHDIYTISVNWYLVVLRRYFDRMDYLTSNHREC